jgi:hypothetical protein
MRRTLVSLALLLSALPASAAPSRVLFIGNSHTYFNEMPSMVARIARADGKRITTKMIAFPDFALEDHLRDGRARTELLRGSWDVAVMQQGPSASAEGRRLLIEGVRGFAPITGRRTKIAMLMIWPRASAPREFPRVEESYRLAAKEADGIFIPAGIAWLRVLVKDPAVPLYADDGFHPGVCGSWLNAMTVYRTLLGPLPSALRTRAGAEKAAGRTLRLTDAQLALLYDVANAGDAAATIAP